MAKQEKFSFSQLNTSYATTDATEVVKRGQDFVWYGNDNLFPQHTIDLYQSSATHNALVNSISAWIYGGGLNATNKENNAEEWLKFQTLINKKIGKNDVQLMCSDIKLHGGYYISMSYNLDRTTLASIDVLPFETMRSGLTDEDGDVEFLYYSQNWKDGRRAKVTKLKAFDPSMKDTFPTQVLFVKMNSVGSYFYPKPDYIGALNYIELDKNIGQFHLANIENGLAPSFMISFNNGIPTKEKRNEVKNNLESELSGSANAGKFITTFSDGRDTSPEITTFDLSDADKQYQFLSEEVTKKVMVSHRVVSPRLFGVIDSGGLGNNAEELQVASTLFEEVVIEPFRQIVLDGLNLVLMEAGIKLNLFFEPFKMFDDEFSENSFDILEILEKVKNNQLSSGQAFTLMTQFNSIDEAVAKSLLSKNIVDAEFNLSKKKDSSEMNDELADFLFEELEKVGEIIDEEEWELKESVEVNTKADAMKFHKIAMATGKNEIKKVAQPQDKSKQDVGMYKIRYAYSQNISKGSRNFCKKMVELSKRKLVFTFEDIQSMESLQFNSQFAPKGKQAYSIWDWKGGCYCHHKWEMKVFVRARAKGDRFDPATGKTIKKGQFLPKSKTKDLEHSQEESVSKARNKGVKIPKMGQGDIRPIDTPTRGKLN